MRHSPCGPSSLERRFLCPGSLNAERGLPETTSADAQRGTDLHAIVTAALKDRSTLDKAEAAGDLDGYEAGLVHACLNAVAKARDTFGEEPELLLDRELDLSSIHPEIAFGTLDVGLVEPFARAVVLDFKFGLNRVPPAAENLQLMAYAAGLAEAFDLESVDVAVIQPAIRHVTEHTWTKAAMGEVVNGLRRIVHECRAPNAPRTPSDRACKYCKAAATCPALGKAVDDVALATAKPAGELAGPELAKWLEACELAETRIGAVRARAYAILSAGGAIPGWGLVEGRKTREWAMQDRDIVAALNDAARELGKDAGAVIRPEIASPAQLEKSWGTSKAVRERLQQLIEYRPGKPKLEKSAQ